ncbi:MAG: hypothetical protein JRJ68_02000 [Deltaproteobacteria bacterium]|nr:hypothetical protein [Deltaproteobacteria bacterium]
MTKTSKVHFFEDEWYMVRYSGEIPEIAYNSALYYLSRAEDGPQITLSTEQVTLLKEAALERYREIVTRDLVYENHTRSTYRGVRRSIENYHRLQKFCSRQSLDIRAIREEAALLLPLLLKIEADKVERRPGRPSIINCTFDELCQFFDDLQIPSSLLSEKIESLFQD